jgi:hypothetical protein
MKGDLLTQITQFKMTQHKFPAQATGSGLQFLSL